MSMLIPKNPVEFKKFLTEMESRTSTKESKEIDQEVDLVMRSYQENGVPDRIAQNFRSTLKEAIDREVKMNGISPNNTRAFQVWQKYFPNTKFE